MTSDLITYVKADATLMGLVTAISPDANNIADLPPRISYRVQAGPGRTGGVRQRQYSFSIFAPKFLMAESIAKRLDFLLDRDEAINIPSNNFYVKSSWHSGESSTFESNTALHHLVVIYTLLYVEK